MANLTFSENIAVLLGAINVTENKGIITIHGINGINVIYNIQRLWGTSKIGKYLFNQASSRILSFHKFFVIEVIYILNKLLQFKRLTVISRQDILKVIQLLNEKTWITEVTKHYPERLDLNKLSDLKDSPKFWQTDFLRHYSNELDRFGLNGCLLNSAAGTGKTYMGLAIAHTLKTNREKVVIVVCPKNTTELVWQNSVENDFKTKRSCWLVYDTKPYNNEEYIICNYERIPIVTALLPLLKNKEIIILLDESHNLNEIVSQRTQAFVTLCKLSKSKNIIFGSGTPFKASGAEAIPMFRVLDDKFTPEVEEKFKKIFGKEAREGLDILQNRLNVLQFVIEKGVLELDKPEFYTLLIKIPNSSDYTLTTIKEEMNKFIIERVEFYDSTMKSNKEFFYQCLTYFEDQHVKKAGSEFREQFKRYKEALNKIIFCYTRGELDVCKEEIIFCNRYELKTIAPFLNKPDAERFKDVRTIIKYVKLKIQGECLGRVLGKKRELCHVDMAKFIDYRSIIENAIKKTIIFTSYVSVVDEAFDRLKQLKYNPIKAYGNITTDITTVVNKFTADPHINPLVTTFKSLSTGVRMPQADVMLMINQPYRPYIQEQAISRIHRLGQDTQTKIYNCLLETPNEANISTRTMDILKWAYEQVTAITGVTSPYDITVESEAFSGNEDLIEVLQDPYLMAGNEFINDWIDPSIISELYIPKDKTVLLSKNSFHEW